MDVKLVDLKVRQKELMMVGMKAYNMAAMRERSLVGLMAASLVLRRAVMTAVMLAVMMAVKKDNLMVE
jgi:hypothetical protein